MSDLFGQVVDEAESAYVRARPGSHQFDRAERTLDRYDQLEEQQHQGHYHPYLEHAPAMAAAAGQIELELSDHERHANVRCQVGDRFTALARELNDPAYGEVADKLYAARRTGVVQLDPQTGDYRKIWDNKAGEPLLCPDDAREAAMRFQRRLCDPVVECKRAGLRVYTGVLTIENAALGGLGRQCKKIWRALPRVLRARQAPRRARSDVPADHLRPHRQHAHRAQRKCRRGRIPVRARVPGCARRRAQQKRVDKKKLPKLFPIEGCLATLEAPLSASRTWHPHLNVIFITRGFFDWGAFNAAWGWWTKFRELEGTPDSVAAAMRELIKYAVRTVPEKSSAKARAAAEEGDGAAISKPDPKAPGPALVEWTTPELVEWWQTMKGMRRTRTYGRLYGLNLADEDEEKHDRWITVGRLHYDGTRFRAWFPLLSSIPGDKSIRDLRARREKYLADLTGPPGEWAQLAAELEEWRQREAFAAMKTLDQPLS